MHSWKKEQAVDYMLSYTAFSREQLEVEINRYSTWPGQATAYKIGELEIVALRAKAKKELGKQLSFLLFFHKCVYYMNKNKGALLFNTFYFLNENVKLYVFHHHVWFYPISALVWFHMQVFYNTSLGKRSLVKGLILETRVWSISWFLWDFKMVYRTKYYLTYLVVLNFLMNATTDWP